jgi:hypothetical protein
VGQYNNRMAVEKTEYSVNVGTVLDSALPDVLRPWQFFKICSWHYSQVFQKAKYPHHLLSHFAGQGIKKILDGAFPIYCLIKSDGSVHGDMLTYTLTSVKLIFHFGNLIEIFHARVTWCFIDNPKDL